MRRTHATASRARAAACAGGARLAVARHDAVVEDHLSGAQVLVAGAPAVRMLRRQRQHEQHGSATSERTVVSVSAQGASPLQPARLAARRR
jgi:hypothetical protein